MLSKVDVVSDLNGNTIVSFPVSDLSGDEDYVITNIDGLAPVKANLAVTDYATDSGGFYTHSHVGIRTIGIDIKIRSNTAKTPKQNRDSLFRWFDIGNIIWLELHDTERKPVRIRGVVESNDFNPFTRDLSHRISVVCTDPYFQSNDRIFLKGTTNDPLNIWGYSNGPTPMHVIVTLTEKTDRVRVWVGDKEGLMLNTSSINVGDRIWISTEPGNKFVRVGKSGNWRNALNILYSGELNTSFGDVNSATTTVKTSPLVSMPLEINFIPRWVSI